jgi:hypothetical protein
MSSAIMPQNAAVIALRVFSPSVLALDLRIWSSRPNKSACGAVC